MTELLLEPILNAASAPLLRIANRLLAGLVGASTTSTVLRRAGEEPWFLAESWQAGEREVDASVSRGEVRVFDDVDAFLASLGGIASVE